MCANAASDSNIQYKRPLCVNGYSILYSGWPSSHTITDFHLEALNAASVCENKIKKSSVSSAFDVDATLFPQETLLSQISHKNSSEMTR